MTFWAGLYNDDLQGKLLEGVQALLACVHRVMARAPNTSTRPTILPNNEEEGQDRED